MFIAKRYADVFIGTHVRDMRVSDASVSVLDDEAYFISICGDFFMREFVVDYACFNTFGSHFFLYFHIPFRNRPSIDCQCLVRVQVFLLSLIFFTVLRL